jgi:hypothetical protein
LLIASDRMHIDFYTRQPDGGWLLKSASRPEESLDLVSVGCRLTVAEVYENVDLSPQP